MAAYVEFEHFIEYVAQGKHNLSLPGGGGDSLKIALVAAANTPNAATFEDYADLTVVDQTNLQSDALTITGSSQTDGTFALTVDTFSVVADGGNLPEFRYICVYNSTPVADGDKGLICYFDYGSSLQLNDGESLAMDWDTDGLFTLGVCPGA